MTKIIRTDDELRKKIEEAERLSNALSCALDLINEAEVMEEDQSEATGFALTSLLHSITAGIIEHDLVGGN